MFFTLKKILASLLVFGLLGAPLQSLSTTQPDQPSVVLNELMWMGSSRSPSDEWIELRNVTNDPVDLANWKLTKKSSGTEVTMLSIPSGVIAPQGYFLIANYANTQSTSVLDIEPDLVDSDVALANSAMQIKLYNAANEIVDVADDGTGNPLAGGYVAGSKYFSMERNSVPGDGSLAQNWHTASAAINLQTSEAEFGTPGAMNSNAGPTAEAGSDIDGVIGEVIQFDGSDSVDPESEPLSFDWDFGDGISGVGVTPSHTYPAIGQYAVSLFVSDGQHTATDTLQVKIQAAVVGEIPNDVDGSSPNTCSGVRISELFPNPAGVDDAEFIELENITGASISLRDCRLWVNEKRVYAFSDEVVPARGFFVAEKTTTKLSLTNDSGTVRLDNVNGAELDRVEYPKAKENLSWSRFADSWGWTETATPGSDNIAPREDGEVAGIQTSVAGDQIALEVVIGEIQEIDSGERVRFSGIVTAPVDALGTRVTFLQDQTGAVSLLLAEEAEKPAVGDRIAVTGTVRSYQGRKRVSVKAEDVVILDHHHVVAPKQLSLDELVPEVADQLVMVSGIISAASGSKISLDDGSGEGIVYLKSSTGILKPKMASGDTLTVTGIVNFTTASGIRVLPRMSDDLRVERHLASAAEVTTTSLPVASPHQTLWYWALVGMGFLVAGAQPAWKAWQRRRALAVLQYPHGDQTEAPDSRQQRADSPKLSRPAAPDR